MIYILTSVSVCLMLLLAILFFQNAKIKHQHLLSMKRLEKIINSLHQHQLLLDNKVQISAEQQSSLREKEKKISEEIVELQKIFMQIISNKKN